MIPRLLRPEASRAALAALIYYLALLSLSTIPGTSLPPSDLPGLDKLIHLTLYAGLGWLLAGTHWPTPILLALALCAGAMDELYQLITPGRQASLGDWLADALGSLTGIWIRQKLAPPRPSP